MKHIGRNPRFDRKRHWAEIVGALGTLGGNYLGTLGNSEFRSVKLLGGHWADIGQTLGRYWMSIFLIQDKTFQFFHAR